MHLFQVISELITIQENLIYFVYGLVYFLMGFAILLQSRDYSTLKIARHLPLLGSFGIVHGLADWGPLFIPWQNQVFSPRVISLLWYIYLGLLVLSFLILFFFGLNLVNHHLNHPWLQVIPGLLFLLWLILFVGYSNTARDSVRLLFFGSTCSRYILAFPAALLTSYGLYGQLQEVNLLGFSRVARYLRGAVIMFALYALFAGIIVPEAPFFPAKWLNYNTFKNVVGIPIQPFRVLIGLGIAYYIIHYLEIFHMEMLQRLEEAEKKQTLLKERERISRDIHDGTLQSLYGVGMRLEHCRYLMKDIPEHPAQAHLLYCINKLNSTIIEIRHYISSGLHIDRLENKKLKESIEELSEELFMNTGVLPHVVYKENTEKELTSEQREHLYMVVKEALNNIAKHAGASEVGINVSFTDALLQIMIEDNGCGFETTMNNRCHNREGKGQGLKNMESRIKGMRGQIRLDSSPGKGTKILIQIPLAKREG